MSGAFRRFGPESPFDDPFGHMRATARSFLGHTTSIASSTRRLRRAPGTDVRGDRLGRSPRSPSSGTGSAPPPPAAMAPVPWRPRRPPPRRATSRPRCWFSDAGGRRAWGPPQSTGAGEGSAEWALEERRPGGEADISWNGDTETRRTGRTADDAARRRFTLSSRGRPRGGQPRVPPRRRPLAASCVDDEKLAVYHVELVGAGTRLLLPFGCSGRLGRSHKTWAPASPPGRRRRAGGAWPEPALCPLDVDWTPGRIDWGVESCYPTIFFTCVGTLKTPRQQVGRRPDCLATASPELLVACPLNKLTLDPRDASTVRARIGRSTTRSATCGHP